MTDKAQRKIKHRHYVGIKRCKKKLFRTLSDQDIQYGGFQGFQNAERKMLRVSSSTSDSHFANQHTSLVNIESSPKTIGNTNRLCLTENSTSSIMLCNDNFKNRNLSPFSLPKPEQFLRPHVTCEQSSFLSTSDDDELNVDSPDSGFYATTPNGSLGSDYFDENSKSDPFEEFSKSSSGTYLNCDVMEESRICLTPPVKQEPQNSLKEPVMIYCKWKDCLKSVSTYPELHIHLNVDHIESTINRSCCLWIGCKVYNMPARSKTWLPQHISAHTGVKRFKCVLGGCDVSFSSQQGLARHVPSHFSEIHLPKARVTLYNERRFLVKRRKINDEKKPLANLHDCMDQRTVDILLGSLVRRAIPPGHTVAPHSTPKVMCKRRCYKGLEWCLTSENKWIKSTSAVDNIIKDKSFFFARPILRCRKNKMPC